VSHTHVACQAQHVAMSKHISHQAVTLPDVEPVLTAGRNAGCVLTTVLEYGQCIVYRLVYRSFANYSYNAAHKPCCSFIVPTALERQFVLQLF
jgi:hypothetical protein